VKKTKSFTYQYKCQRCERSFFLEKLRGGKQEYCDKCGPIMARIATRKRVARHRAAKREAENTSQKTTRANDGGPVPVGTSNAPTSAADVRDRRGLYAAVKEPERTEKRKRVGLR
jgi:DNA-directed RNA polymerase subunit RPC12/RpoP